MFHSVKDSSERVFFQGPKTRLLFWGGRCPRKNYRDSEGEPRRMPDLGFIRTSYYIAALTEGIAWIQYLRRVLRETRGQALLAPRTFSREQWSRLQCLFQPMRFPFPPARPQPRPSGMVEVSGVRTAGVAGGPRFHRGPPPRTE